MIGLPPLRDLLDPRETREAEASPIEAAVNIPLAEMRGRMHELPPKHVPVRVAAQPELAARTIEWLEAGGRRAVVAESWVHGSSPSPGRLWRPNAFLEEVLEKLAPGVAVDLGCGAGRESVAMAARGWRVLAFDVLPDALAKGADLERRTLGAKGIEWSCRDLEDGGFALPGGIDLVASFSYLHRPLLLEAQRALREGGSVLVETFTDEHRARFGRPRTERFALRAGELAPFAEGMEIVHLSEAWREDGRHTGRLWARRA